MNWLLSVNTSEIYMLHNRYTDTYDSVLAERMSIDTLSADFFEAYRTLSKKNGISSFVNPSGFSFLQLTTNYNLQDTSLRQTQATLLMNKHYTYILQ